MIPISVSRVGARAAAVGVKTKVAVYRERDGPIWMGGQVAVSQRAFSAGIWSEV